jgi:hypothetical protein
MLRYLIAILNRLSGFCGRSPHRHMDNSALYRA